MYSFSCSADILVESSSHRALFNIWAQWLKQKENQVPVDEAPKSPRFLDKNSLGWNASSEAGHYNYTDWPMIFTTVTASLKMVCPVNTD